MDASIVIPVRNECDNVIPLIHEIRSALNGRLDYEVIYVDDGSSDQTLQRLKEARGSILPGLRVLRHRRGCGQSAAIRTGIAAARARWVVTLDGDGQNDPTDIPGMLACATAPGAPADLHLVVGHRRVRRDGWVRRLSSRIANHVRSRLLADGIPDTGCGLKVISRDAFLRLPYFDHMHRFMPALVQANGGCVRSVEVNHRPRRSGRSHYGIRNRLWAGIIDLLGVMWLQRRATLPSIEGTEGQ